MASYSGLGHAANSRRARHPEPIVGKSLPGWLVAVLRRSRRAGPEAHAATGAQSLTVTSSAFTNDGTIPTEFTCSGADHSPPLR